MSDLLDYALNTQDVDDLANDRVFNERFCEHLTEARDGELRKEAAAGEVHIKRRQRERSVVRRLLDFETAGDDRLVKDPREEMPIIWGTLQNDSRGAVSLSMKDTADQESFWRDTFIVRFFVISTPEYYKNTFELKGHPQDTVKALTEDMLLDIEEEEDRRWFTTTDQVVGAINGLGEESGLPQHMYAGEFSRANHIDSQYLFSDRKLPTGVFVVNERFMANFQKLPRDLIGGDLSQDLFKQGGAALKDGVVGGIRHLFTSKNNFVPNNVMYQYTASDHLGVAYEHQAPTMFMEKKKRTIFFSLEEIVAMAMVNTAGIFKLVFQNDPDWTPPT
jgi:hypothetical protein